MTEPTIVQHASQSAFNEFAAVSTFVNVVLGTAPTVGNILVAFITGQAANWAPAIPGFTLMDSNTGGQAIASLQRVVQAGDTATVACTAFSSGHADWVSAAVYEVNGQAATPIDAHNSAVSSTNAVTVSATATPALDLALAGVATNFGGTAVDLSVAPGTWTFDEFVDNNSGGSHFHPLGVAHRTTGTTIGEVVAPTFTWTNFNTNVIASLVLIAPFVASTSTYIYEIQQSLSILAGQTTPPYLEAQKAANVYAGTVGMETTAALNHKNGSTGLDFQKVCNALNGTTTMDAQDALSDLAGGGHTEAT